MASRTLKDVNDSKDIQCRYFVNGACMHGDRCIYKHDFNAKPDNVCRFYLAGNCSYGKACRYDHVRKKPDGNARASSSQGRTATSPVKAAAAASAAHHASAAGTSASAAALTLHEERTKEQRPPPAVALPSQRLDGSETRPSTMTVLKKSKRAGSSMPASWADAPAFVPRAFQSSSASSDYRTESEQSGGVSYSQAAGGGDFAAGYGDGSGYDFTYGHSNGADYGYDHSAYGGSGAAFSGHAAAAGGGGAAAGAYGHAAAEEDAMLPGETYGSEPYQYTGRMRDHKSSDTLCPYAEKSGNCPYGDNCSYLHGDICDICQLPALHPTDAKQRKAHEKECTACFEQDMESAFAAQRTEGVACGICYEVVCDKADPKNRYFGLLSGCQHPFCLACIRTWRASPQNKTIIRACPVCRAPSHFVTPSKVWIQDPDEKLAIIEQYKEALSQRPCKYFKQGAGECPFGGSCFYRHALPDGSLAPATKPVTRRKQNADGELSVIDQFQLAGFIFVDEFALEFDYMGLDGVL